MVETFSAAFAAQRIATESNCKADSAVHNMTDELLTDISQEYQLTEMKGPPINEKLAKIFQDLSWGIHKKEKVEQVQKESLSPSNMENLDVQPVNIEITPSL